MSHDWPALRAQTRTLADLLQIPREPLRGGLEALVRGRLHGGCWRHTPEMWQPWQEGKGSCAELIRMEWYNTAPEGQPYRSGRAICSPTAKTSDGEEP